MKTDLERWVDLEGPPPKGVRELLDTVVPPMTPELQAELDEKVFAAIARDDRRRAQRRTVAWAIAAVFLLAFLATGGRNAAEIAQRYLKSNEKDGLRAEPVPADRAAKQPAPDAGARRR